MNQASHLLFHPSTPLTDTVKELMEILDILEEKGTAYLSGFPQTAFFLPQSTLSKNDIVAYYAYAQSLFAAIDRADRCLSRLSEWMIEADRKVRPELVSLGDELLGEYLSFRSAINDFLIQSEEIVRAEEADRSADKIILSAKELARAEERFYGFLRNFEKNASLSPEIT